MYYTGLLQFGSRDTLTVCSLFLCPDRITLGTVTRHRHTLDFVLLLFLLMVGIVGELCWYFWLNFVCN